MLPQIEPVLPKLVNDVPRERQWVYEVKLDGFRGTLYVEAGHGRFLSKTKKPLRRFDELANTIAKELTVRDAILDGEVVVLGEGGPQFNALMMNRARRAMSRSMCCGSLAVTFVRFRSGVESACSRSS